MTTRDRIARAIAILGAAFFIVFGVWAFFSPRSFYDRIALFPPYNEHFLHDVGAFQIGLGATLLLALTRRDALVVALAGVGIGSAMHAIAHAIDTDLGGRSADPFSLALLALVLAAGVALRFAPGGRTN